MISKEDQSRQTDGSAQFVVIKTLHSQGLSIRQISRILGLNRRTVSRRLKGGFKTVQIEKELMRLCYIFKVKGKAYKLKKEKSGLLAFGFWSLDFGGSIWVKGMVHFCRSYWYSFRRRLAERKIRVYCALSF